MVMKMYNGYYKNGGEKAAEAISIERFFSCIRSDEKQPLFEYVNEELQQVLELYVKQCQKVEDDENTVYKLLSRDDIKQTIRIAYLKLYSDNITNLKQIEDKTIWKAILDSEKIEVSQKNMLDYFFGNELQLDDSLINYINKFPEGMQYKLYGLENEYGEGADSKIFVAIVKCNEIENIIYEAMTRACNRHYTSLNVVGVEIDKMNILVKNHIIRMTEENLLFIRKNYGENIHAFILENAKEYMQLISEETFDEEEMLYLLEQDIPEADKLTLLSYASEPISIEEKNLSTELQEYIIENHYDESDLEYVLAHYSDFSEKTKSVIYKLAFHDYAMMLDKNIMLNDELAIDLLNDEDIEKNDRIELLITQVGLEMKKETAVEAFPAVGLSELVKVFKGKHPIIIDTNENERLLDELKARKWISSYKEEVVEGKKVFRVFGNKKQLIMNRELQEI